MQVLVGQRLKFGQNKESSIDTADNVEQIDEDIIETADEENEGNEYEKTFDENKEIGD